MVALFNTIVMWLLFGRMLIYGVSGSSLYADWEYTCRPEHPDCHGAWEALRVEVMERQRMTPGLTPYNESNCERNTFDEESARWVRYVETTTSCKIKEEQIPGTGSTRGWEGTLCTWLKINMIIETEVQKGGVFGQVRHRLTGVLGPTREYFYTSRTTYSGKLEGRSDNVSTSPLLPDGQYSYSIVSQSKFDQVGPCIFDESLDPDGGAGGAGRVQVFVTAMLAGAAWSLAYCMNI